MAFHIVRNDITHMNVDAIVNSANPSPTFAFGTDFAIYSAAGAATMLEERKAIGIIAPGEVGVTSAGALKATFVIHTVAPLWEGGERNELAILQSCYENSLRTASELHCESIAFPLLATGVYGFPKEKALEIAMLAIQRFLLKNDMTVFLVVFDESSFVLSGKVFDEIQTYIDANYLAEKGKREYQNLDVLKPGPLSPEDSELRESALRQLEPLVILDVNGRETQNSELASDTFAPLKKHDEYTGNPVRELTFQEKLFQFIDSSGMKSSAIYKPIEMSRQQYSKIQCNRAYQPKKNTAILLALVLRLSLKQTEDLLSRAGYAFNPSSKQDMIVKACILNSQYDLFVIDAMMQKNGLDTLIDYEGKEYANRG